MTTTNSTSTPSNGTETNRPASTIDSLHDRVNAIYGCTNGLNKQQLVKLNTYIDVLADKYNLRQEGYKTHRSDTSAVLRLYRDKGLIGHDAQKAWFYKNGTSMNTLNDDSYLQMLAAATVKGFVERSTAPEDQILKVSQWMDAEANTAMQELPDKAQQKAAALYNKYTATDEIDGARNKMTNNKMVNGTVRVGALAVGGYGLISSIRNFFSATKENGEKKGFWNRVGELLTVGAFAYATYNFGVKGRSFAETATETNKVIGSWTGKIVGEQNRPAVSFTQSL